MAKPEGCLAYQKQFLAKVSSLKYNGMLPQILAMVSYERYSRYLPHSLSLLKMLIAFFKNSVPAQFPLPRILGKLNQGPSIMDLCSKQPSPLESNCFHTIVA